MNEKLSDLSLELGDYLENKLLPVYLETLWEEIEYLTLDEPEIKGSIVNLTLASFSCSIKIMLEKREDGYYNSMDDLHLMFYLITPFSDKFSFCHPLQINMVLQKELLMKVYEVNKEAFDNLPFKVVLWD